MKNVLAFLSILVCAGLGIVGCLGSAPSPATSGSDGAASSGNGVGSGGGGGGAPALDGGTSLDGAVAGDGGAGPGAGAPPLVPSPLTGTVTQGTWQYGDLPFTGIATGKFHYAYLLPSGYSTAHRYPIFVYEHENTEGNSWYQNGGDPTQNTIVNQDVIDGVFNSVAFRTRYPAIVIVPFCDQTDGSAGSSGQNFGGYNDTPRKNVNENAVVAVVQSFLTHYSAYPGKVYITGDSLGGIGSIATMLDYNAYNGPIARVFTAALPYAGQIALRNPDPADDAATIKRMMSVPMWCVSGANDTTSPPENFNRPLWRNIAGNSGYPSATDAAGSRAGSSQYHYTEDPGLGHDVWSQNGGRQYRLLPDGAPMYDWLFSQTSN